MAKATAYAKTSTRYSIQRESYQNKYGHLV